MSDSKAKATVCVTVDFDAVSIWMSWGAPGNRAMSRGEFGANVGAGRLLDLFRRHGIATTGAWMAGFDFQTPENIEEDLAYFVSLQPTMQQLTRLCPFPATKMWLDMKDQGRIREDVQWEEISFFGGGGVPAKNFTEEQMMSIIDNGYKRLYETWGPTMARQLDVALKGYEHCTTVLMLSTTGVDDASSTLTERDLEQAIERVTAERPGEGWERDDEAEPPVRVSRCEHLLHPGEDLVGLKRSLVGLPVGASLLVRQLPVAGVAVPGGASLLAPAFHRLAAPPAGRAHRFLRTAQMSTSLVTTLTFSKGASSPHTGLPNCSNRSVWAHQ